MFAINSDFCSLLFTVRKLKQHGCVSLQMSVDKLPAPAWQDDDKTAQLEELQKQLKESKDQTHMLYSLLLSLKQVGLKQSPASHTNTRHGEIMGSYSTSKLITAA